MSWLPEKVGVVGADMINKLRQQFAAGIFPDCFTQFIKTAKTKTSDHFSQTIGQKHAFALCQGNAEFLMNQELQGLKLRIG